MLTISDAAAEKSIEILSAEGKAGWGLRFFTAGGGCCGPSFSIDIVEKPTKGDKVIEKNGAKFFIEKNASENLEGKEIHFVDDGQNQGFVINSGEAPSCGCGCE